MPTKNNWQLPNPIHAIVFDCDGTLSTIEGIDELAAENHVGAKVSALTEHAMGKAGMNPELYGERLRLTLPNEQQVLNLANLYRQHIVPDVEAVIQILRSQKKKIFIASAGLKPAINLFGATLQIPANNIFAVNIQFDANGDYLNFDHTSPLTTIDGKRKIAQTLLQQYQTVAHIGDGMNDFIVHDLVTRFIGYGGAYYRASIEAKCEFYIKSKSMAGCLPLLLTQEEAKNLKGSEQDLYEKGLREMNLQAAFPHKLT